MNLRILRNRWPLTAMAVMMLATVASGELRAILPVAVPGAGATSGLAGLHIPQTKRASFTYPINDGAGFRWDIQYYGSIGSGTNYAYSGGLYCQISGSNVSTGGVGWVNKGGDEIEIGPYSRSNLRIYRRVRVYKDRGLARWLDIFENPTSRPVQLPVAIYSNTNYTINQTTTSSGGAVFGEKDWAFFTRTSGANSPRVLHMVCGKRSKIRPTVQTTGSQIYVRWNLTIPPKKTVILCYFESQANTDAVHNKTMKSFRISQVLRDLSPAVRRLIVNWSTGGFAGIDLERSDKADTVMIAGGGPKYGKITNTSFQVKTFFGPVKLPAAQIVGMAAGAEENASVRFVLLDGQIVSAAMPDEKVLLELPTGGTLRIPFDRIAQWSYRISPERPMEGKFSGPYVMLRTGDRVAFQGDSANLRFRTRHGTVKLDPKAMLHVTLDNTGNTVHQAHFINGSHVGGFLEPSSIVLKLRLGPTMTVRRDMIVQLRFAPEEKPNDSLAYVSLTNEDELYGRLGGQAFDIISEFGTIPVKPANLRTISFSATKVGYAVLTLWDGTVLRGQVGTKPMSFNITPGPTLKINPVQVIKIVCPEALPPDHIVTRTRKLMALLSSESYADRKKATEELVRLGQGITPILRRYLLEVTDPEVSQRIEEILSRIGVAGKVSRTAPNPPNPLNRLKLLNVRLRHDAMIVKFGC